MSTTSSRTPPKFIQRLLGLLLPPARREEVLGDLEEQFLAAPPSRALWQYLFEVVALLPSILYSLRRCLSPGVGVPTSLETGSGIAAVRRQVEEFQQANHYRWLFYLTCAVLISGFLTWKLLLAHFWLQRIVIGGFVAIFLCTAWQHHVRGSGRTVPAGASLSVLVDFHRRELARRRDFLRTLWYWKMAPLAMPMIFALAVKRNWHTVGTLSCVVVCYALSAMVARRQARVIQQRIDELDALR